MTKVTFEQYVKTEFISGLTKIKPTNEEIGVLELAEQILTDYNPSDDDAFMFFADKKHRDCVYTAVNEYEYEDFDSLVNGLFAEDNASTILKTAVCNTIMYNITKAFRNIDSDDVIPFTSEVIEKLKSLTLKNLKIIKSWN